MTGRRMALVAGLAVAGLVAAGCGAPPVPAATPTTVPATTAPAPTPTSVEPTQPATSDVGSTTTTVDLPAPLAEPIGLTGDVALDASLLEMARFVETTRGRPFLQQVDVQFLDDAAFEAVVAGESDDDVEVAALRTQGEMLTVLGLLPEGVDFVQLVRISQREGIIGLYMPGTGELWVRGVSATPLVRTTVVHELTHALDDQWFPDGWDGVTDADQAFAYSSLAEGSATYVEDLYREAMSPADVVASAQAARDYWEQMVVPNWPVSVTELSESVYSLGNRFVTQLVDDGGIAALDAAYAAPPRSTEQLLHPERYLAGDRPVTMDRPDADGTVVDEGVMGEWSLVELLNAELAPSDARAAAEGWAGDRYVLTDDGVQRCVVLEVQADSEADADELDVALTRWAGRADGATAERTDDLTMRLVVCRPS